MSLREIRFPPQDEPLKDDVGLLGDLVGRVLREQGGEELFACVEAARHAAIRRREGGEGPDGLHAVLGELSAERAAEVVRGFSTYFQVVNLAERVHRIRRGRERMRTDTEPRSGSLVATVRALLDMGVEVDALPGLFAGARVEPVFTAHPTESTRRVILDKQERIARRLISRLDPSRTPHEERVALARIREDITTAWQTDEHPAVRPTVVDEREHVLYYVSHVLYDVVPALHERLDQALREAGLEAEPGVVPRSDEPPLLRPGSWVGGDMDGNPNVTARTVRATLRRHRSLALRAYASEIVSLKARLTQSESRVDWSDGLADLIERYGVWFPEVRDGIPDRLSDMGYRSALDFVAARMDATETDDEHGYGGPGELVADLDLIADSLRGNGGEHAGLFGVVRLLRRVRTFGFHMAVLDVRQDARELRDVVADLLDDPRWPDRAAAERVERLHGLLTDSDRTVANGSRTERAERDAGEPSTERAERESDGLSTERAERALEVFRAIAEGRRAYGVDAIGSYIISMAQDVDDVLTVLWLARVAGLGSDGAVPLDVAPLFETVPDLDRAESVLDRLFVDEVVAPHLASRDGRQMVMVGYSDSNKDGGIASARWALQRALEGMADAATRHDVTLTVFHGRGGTVSRGGGSVESAVAAMPAASIGGRLRLTEQGEVIDAKYGLPQIALRNLERMLGSIVLKGAEGTRATPEPWRALADTMAGAARRSYRALVYEDAAFTPYFRAGTPIDVIERMAIGSRPASRRDGAGVEDLRAIPWVFSWTQCRAILTGWYGLGTGLDAVAAEHGEEALKEAAEGWPFLGALLADVEMVLAKADLEIAGLYTELAPPESHRIFHTVRSEFDRTVDRVLAIRGHTALLDGDPTLQRSIRLRNPYVDPMNVLQVDLLRRWRANERSDEAIFEALLATVNGIARGLQNTG